MQDERFFQENMNRGPGLEENNINRMGPRVIGPIPFGNQQQQGPSTFRPPHQGPGQGPGYRPGPGPGYRPGHGPNDSYRELNYRVDHLEREVRMLQRTVNRLERRIDRIERSMIRY